MWSVLFTIVAVLALICIWVMIYDGNRFVVRHHEFCDSRIRKDCRAVVLADLHNKLYGRDNERLLAAIKEAAPDMVLVAGDILTSKPGKTLDIALHLMEELSKDYPVYYGNGNHEQRLLLYPDVYGDMGERYREGLKNIGIEPVINAHVQLDELGITIYGSEIDRLYYKRFKVQEMPSDYMESILGPVDKSSYSILLAHNPDYFPQYAAWGADLVLSGHVHGGMVRVPFWGKGVASPSFRLFPEYDGGLFEEGTSKMLLSRGLGMHTIPVRVFNPGELLVVDFKSEQRT
ncbi:MAG: hypothetical protein E7292_04850 [Lachnospiraceae bacterium]|nr:hypothetical protein [Lachnospiraceae bacterium]